MAEQLGELVNEIAVKVNETLDAGATVVMSLVIDSDGIPVLLVGSTGVRDAVHLLTGAMPQISTALREAADGGESVRKGLFIRGDADAN